MPRQRQVGSQRLGLGYPKIAKRIKTRDEHFEKDANGVTVNRCLAICQMGSANINNEEDYLVNKLMRSLGVIDLDHCARL